MTNNRSTAADVLRANSSSPASPPQVMTLFSSDLTVAVFNSIPGQGVIYSVIVRDPLLGTSASYVPVHTYACSFTSTLDGCQTLGELPCASDTQCVALQTFYLFSTECINFLDFIILESNSQHLQTASNKFISSVFES